MLATISTTLTDVYAEPSSLEVAYALDLSKVLSSQYSLELGSSFSSLGTISAFNAVSTDLVATDFYPVATPNVHSSVFIQDLDAAEFIPGAMSLDKIATDKDQKPVQATTPLTLVSKFAVDADASSFVAGTLFSDVFKDPFVLTKGSGSGAQLGFVQYWG